MNWLHRGMLLVPWPQEIQETGEPWTCPRRFSVSIPPNASAQTHFTAQWLAEDLRCLTLADVTVTDLPQACQVGIWMGLVHDVLPPRLPRTPGRAEGYGLAVRRDAVCLVGDDEAGLAHAAQTMAQLVAFADPKGTVPGVSICDWPQYALRSVMLDIGRAPHPRALIERVIRLAARLKLNALHLHLHDNELNGVRYSTMPLGSENPHALPIAVYGELIQYAHQYHIAVIPELEAWGHVASLLYHYPALYGTAGPYGLSFGIGEPTYKVLEAMLTEWMPMFAGNRACLHVGLDEADWALLPDVSQTQRGAYTPVTHIRRIYEISQRLADQHGAQVEMHLWADHGGRPIPSELRDDIVVEPWSYHEGDAERIADRVQKHAGVDGTRFVMGAGASFIHEQGAFGATKLWCRLGTEAPNCRGVTLCLWGTNDVGGRLLTLFAGADYAWTPDTPADLSGDSTGERLRGTLVRRMKHWQAHFPDADPAAIASDRGPEVLMGRYCWPPRVGLPVAPTVDWEDFRVSKSQRADP